MEHKKYKVLIADDEYWTREKLRRMIEWEKYALECMEPASNGEEVLKRMQEEAPDILITDINMPYVNGVELLREVKEKYPEVIPFVISGYDDFAYVKDSFLAGSVNYLLKPVSKLDLVNALSKALEKISEKQNRREELQKAASLIQDREFSRLLEKQTMPLVPNMTENSKVDFNSAEMLLVKIHNMQELIQEYHYDQYLLSWSVKKKLQEIAGEEKETVIFNHIYRSNEFLMILPLEGEEGHRLAARIANYFGRTTKAPVTVVRSGYSCSLESIHHAYTQMIACLMTRRFTAENQIMNCREQKAAQSQKIEARFGETQIQELRQLLKKGKSGSAKAYIRSQLSGAPASVGGWSYLDMRQTVKKIVNLIQEVFAGRMDAEAAVDMENFADLADRITGMMNLDYLCEMLDEVVDYAVSMGEPAVAESTRGLVKQAAAYIDEHYFEDLTLSSLAGRFHVESSYFSRLFRQETGENVMLYIADTRIRHAREYICEGKKSLTEIAFLTGYDDYTYFNRVFRKMTGMSPREYKNRYSDQ